MKKSTTRIHLKRAIDKYNSKKNDAIISGELFTFGIQIKRKNGKIYVRETSNAKTIFSHITESVRDDTKTDIQLLKCHLISEVLQKLETGFDRFEHPIGGSKTEPNNDATFKIKAITEKSNLPKINNPTDDFNKSINQKSNNLEEEMKKSADRMKKLDERRKQLEDFLNKMSEDGEKREQDYKNFMENSKKTLEDCNRVKDILEQLSDMFLSGENSNKKEALIKELEKLGVPGVEALRNNDFPHEMDKFITKKDIH